MRVARAGHATLLEMSIGNRAADDGGTAPPEVEFGRIAV